MIPNKPPKDPQPAGRFLSGPQNKRLPVGTKVWHGVFGSGEIMQFHRNQMSHELASVTIWFRAHGLKTILTSYLEDRIKRARSTMAKGQESEVNMKTVKTKAVKTASKKSQEKRTYAAAQRYISRLLKYLGENQKAISSMVIGVSAVPGKRFTDSGPENNDLTKTWCAVISVDTVRFGEDDNLCLLPMNTLECQGLADHVKNKMRLI